MNVRERMKEVCPWIRSWPKVLSCVNELIFLIRYKVTTIIQDFTPHGVRGFEIKTQPNWNKHA